MKNGIKLAALIALALGLILPTAGFAQSEVSTSSGTAKSEKKETKPAKKKHGKIIKKEKKPAAETPPDAATPPTK